MRAKEFNKPRNFVAKNAKSTTGGAGIHKDKRKAEKQGDVKHKKDLIPTEGWQDFNKVEPYYVCLAGKPVKKFDYYEEARRFHDNWKQKLYREGDKEKADKITLMPVMDEDFQYPSNPAAVAKQQATVNQPASTSRADVKTFSLQGYTVKFKPDVMEIYYGPNLVYSKPGNYANPTRAQLGNARARITDLDYRKKQGVAEAAVNPQFINVQVTKILAREAQRMTNAPIEQLLAPLMKEYNLTVQQINSMVPGGLKKAAGEYGVMVKGIAEGQLDELSPETLKSYIKKSKGHSQKYDQKGNKADEKGDEELANKMWNKGDNRYAGAEQARVKLADLKDKKKGVVEGTDELAKLKKKYQSYSKSDLAPAQKEEVLKRIRKEIQAMTDKQGVAEDWIDDNAAEPLARYFADLYYGDFSATEKVKLTSHIYQSIQDGRLSIDQLKADIDTLEKEKGIKEATSSRDKWNKASAEREKKHNDIEAKRQAAAKQGKENMSGAINRLEKQLSK